MPSGVIELSGIAKFYGTTEVLTDVNLKIAAGEFVVFVGPSGCGKSTLLRMIAGLEEITAGELRMDGELINNTHPAKRQVAMVFQSYALYPHMTVAENIGFSMKLAGAPKPDITAKVRAAAETLQIEELLKRKPADLSGGQRQRVAIGRAIVRDPKVFLFDEPLSNLDAALRVHMRLELERLHGELGATMIYVTHDQVEAMTLADKIVVLSSGGVQQVGSPIELYLSPANRFVANFIGSPSMNFLSGQLSDSGRVSFLAGALPDLPLVEGARSGPVTIGIRPEHLHRDGKGDFKIAAKVSQTELLGAETLLYFRAGDKTLITVREAGISSLRPGDTVELSAAVNDLRLFEGHPTSGIGRALLDYETQLGSDLTGDLRRKVGGKTSEGLKQTKRT